MASPWKFLARLVSPRRQQRQEHGSTDDVKPNVLAIAKPTETAANDEVNAADRPADEKPVPHGDPAAVLADPDHAKEPASNVDDTTDIESTTLEKAADPSSSNEADIAADAAVKPSRIDEGARKRSRKAKKAEVDHVVSRPPRRVANVSEDAISLDGEIRLLRDQLARKLRLQNAQLKRMLDRFER
jgi:hypothetical protein